MDAKGLTLRQEANAIIGHVFTNGFLEELHTGKRSKVLQRPGFSRITDEEMKKLMVECSAKLTELLRKKEEQAEEYWKVICFFHENYTKNWVNGENH